MRRRVSGAAQEAPDRAPAHLGESPFHRNTERAERKKQARTATEGS